MIEPNPPAARRACRIDGAALAVSGASMQGLFRNPLADPGLIGISAGAACGAVSVMCSANHTCPRCRRGPRRILLSAAAFAGCLTATLLMLRLSMHDGHPVVATMLLAGVAINALASALTAVHHFLANDQQGARRHVLAARQPRRGHRPIAIVAPAVLAASCCCRFVARALNGLLLGEAEASHLGFDVVRTKWLVILLSTVMVGVSVAFAGVIGFVGLIVPHAIRLVAGPTTASCCPHPRFSARRCWSPRTSSRAASSRPRSSPSAFSPRSSVRQFFLWLLLRVKAVWQP